MNRRESERYLITRIFQASNSLQRFIDLSLKDSEVTAKQFYLMIFVGAFRKAPTVTQLSEVLGTSRQNAKQIALKLEKSGYINIMTDEVDNRIKRLYLTEKANAFWSNRDEDDDQTMTDLYKGLLDEELVIANKVLSVILERVS